MSFRMSSTSTRNQIKPYHKDHHLLLQFILAEFILTHEKLSKIEKHFYQKKEVSYDELLSHLVQLSGSSQEYMRILTWNDAGILTKLNNYCACFCEKDGHIKKTRMNMLREANRAWLFSLQMIDTLKSYHPSKTLHPAVYKRIQTMLKKVRHCMVRLCSLLKDTLLEFTHNENILLFLLRHQEELDEIYQDRFVSKLFHKLFSKNLDQANQFLISKYTLRGFDELIPWIEAKMISLKE